MSADCVQGTALVHAPIDRLWALSTRVELVKETLGMNAVRGVTEGFVRNASLVVWKGWKFGLPTEHHTRITGFNPPHAALPERLPGDEAKLKPELHAEDFGQPVAWFQDTQERGRFAFFQHDHWLREQIDPDGTSTTVLEDEVHFRLPFGALGRLTSRLILLPYVRRLVQRRFATLKELAEGDGWQQWL